MRIGIEKKKKKGGGKKVREEGVTRRGVASPWLRPSHKRGGRKKGRGKAARKESRFDLYLEKKKRKRKEGGRKRLRSGAGFASPINSPSSILERGEGEEKGGKKR